MENTGLDPHTTGPTRGTIATSNGNCLHADSSLPRIAMVSTHGYVAAQPPLGAADTGGQVVYVLELSKKLAQLGYEVDIWTRRFEDQTELEPVAEQVRIIRVPCGGRQFIPKEYLSQKLPQWGENALRFIKRHALKYWLIDSHYWDAGVAGQHLSEALDVPHVHTPHSLGLWKNRQMENDYPGDAAKFEKQYNFTERIRRERILYADADLVVATTPPQLDLLKQDYEAPVDNCRMIPPGYDDMGDDKLKVIATELITQVRKSVTIDWTLRESARARIRVMVKRILNRYGYPPDLQEEAVKTVLAQAELLCADWAA